MDKQEFLNRCATAFDAGYINDNMLDILSLAIDYTSRIQGDQEKIAKEIMQEIEVKSKGRQLATFKELYDCTQFASLLNNPCEKCANDKGAWHTRSGFCEHKQNIGF